MQLKLTWYVRFTICLLYKLKNPIFKFFLAKFSQFSAIGSFELAMIMSSLRHTWDVGTDFGTCVKKGDPNHTVVPIRCIGVTFKFTNIGGHFQVHRITGVVRQEFF